MSEPISDAAVLAVAIALRDEAKKFDDPVYIYVEREARYRFEADNPDKDIDWDFDWDLESWKILARAALAALPVERMER